MGDWRLRGQERYLKGVKLRPSVYAPYRDGWDHDHCEFCSRKFGTHEGDLREGYVTEDQRHWVCYECYGEFKSSFDWKVDA